jgi:hypothetical protein
LRTLRIFISAGALLAGSAIGAAAQEEESPAVLPIAVAGNTNCHVYDRGASGDSDALVQGASGVRGQVLDCVSVASDPRVSGEFRTTFNDDCFPLEGRAECVVWGTSSSGDPTGWDCSYAGTSDPAGDNDAVTLGICAGTGDHEGLTYIYQAAISFGGVGDFGDGTNMKGIVYEGEPPPLVLPLPE